MTELYKKTTWEYTINIDSNVTSASNLNFQTARSLEDVAQILEDSLIGGGTFHVEGNSLVCLSDSTGVSSTMSYMSGSGADYVGALLGLDEATGATLVDTGSDEETLPGETKTDAVTACHEVYKFGGYTFIDTCQDQEIANLASWNQANAVLGYITVTGDSKLEIDETNPAWEVVLNSQTNTRLTYSPAGNKKLATGYNALMHTVNFSGANTAKTMHLKSLANVQAEYLNDTDVSKAKQVGLDIYTTIKNVPCILSSGA